MAVIRTSGLTKFYGRVRGIEDLDLEVRKGEIFGFLGPNGAGKTTAIRLLLGLLHPTRGRAEVLGQEAGSIEARQRIGYVPGEVAFYEGMTGEELLGLLGRFHRGDHRERQEYLARCLDLDLKRPIRGYSRGMKQKLAVIQALRHDPDLLILDEPTLGLDPLVQREFYTLLMEEKGRGKTVFLSSHILPEVERVADRVGIVREGHLAAVEDVGALKLKKVRRLQLWLREEVPAQALELEGVEVLSRQGKHLELAVHGHIERLLPWLSRLPVEEMVFAEASLEDTFMKFYKKETG